MNNEHKYILQPYKGISTRHTCPACKHKGEFTLYIDMETNQPLHPSVGRCNRDQKCGYHYTPSQYFKDYPEAKPKDDWQPQFVPTQRPTQKVEIDYLPDSFIPTLMQIEKNNLYRFFCSTFGESKSREVFGRYRVGTSRHWINDGGFSTAFPQIDTEGRLRQIKVIAYNPTTGKRLHKEHPAQKITPKGYTIDTVLDKVWFAAKSLLNRYDANLVQTFFGCHLLNDASEVAIVESEKTAMIASLYFPESVWLGTGGKNGCRWTTPEVSKVLKGKRVMLYPDLGCFDAWTKDADVLRSHGLNVKVSRYLEEHATNEERVKGLDIGDYLLKEPLPKVEEQPQKQTTIGDVMRWVKELEEENELNEKRNGNNNQRQGTN